MKILVVEDNIKILKSICDELDNHFDTYKCSDGEDALYQINQNIYDLIILDIMLPGINGLDILKSIRKNIETPVLILTAKEELDDKVKAFEIGANDYLTKPFYMEELVARVYAILRTTGKLKNKNVLLVDDIFTTGSTVNEISKILKINGVNKVFVSTFLTRTDTFYVKA